jgi:hypothetical protein
MRGPTYYILLSQFSILISKKQISQFSILKMMTAYIFSVFELLDLFYHLLCSHVRARGRVVIVLPS